MLTHLFFFFLFNVNYDKLQLFYEKWFISFLFSSGNFDFISLKNMQSMYSSDKYSQAYVGHLAEALNHLSY